MCEGGVKYVRDGIISWSIGTIGKLKRVQSNRDGWANVALNKSLKNLHDYWCEGHWSIVIQARGFIVLRHRDDDGFFKGGGNHRGSKGLIKDWGEQTSKLISAGPPNTARNPSGPAAFLTFTLFSALRTLSSDTVITWLSLLCLLLPDCAARVTQLMYSIIWLNYDILFDDTYYTLVGLGDMSKNWYLCIFWLICSMRYISRYFVFGLNK